MTTPPRRRPTLDEVARLAGVSRAAASRAINQSGHASRSTREAVERAVRELGYVPNPTARALATRQSGAVVLAISHHDSELFADPFYAQIIAGVSAALERTDLLLMLALADSELGRARLERVLRSRHADGIMLMGLHGDDPLYHLAGKLDLPVVYGGRPMNAEPAWYVDADNRGGARLAGEHLVGIGRRRIAALTGSLDTYVGAARLGGFQDALAVAGLAPGLVEHGDFTEASGAAAMGRLLAAEPDVDAVFAASDSMAAGALRVLKVGRPLGAGRRRRGRLRRQRDLPLHQPAAHDRGPADQAARLGDGEDAGQPHRRRAGRPAGPAHPPGHPRVDRARRAHRPRRACRVC